MSGKIKLGKFIDLAVRHFGGWMTARGSIRKYLRFRPCWGEASELAYPETEGLPVVPRLEHLRGFNRKQNFHFLTEFKPIFTVLPTLFYPFPTKTEENSKRKRMWGAHDKKFKLKGTKLLTLHIKRSSEPGVSLGANSGPEIILTEAEWSPELSTKDLAILNGKIR